jgi:hypothetical protein
MVDEDNWFPRQCCVKYIAFDKRTPGLFKHKPEGTDSYVLKEDHDHYKLSCKGMNKARIHDPFEIL